jgi:hypothetical protein
VSVGQAEADAQVETLSQDSEEQPLGEHSEVILSELKNRDRLQYSGGFDSKSLLPS